MRTLLYMYMFSASMFSFLYKDFSYFKVERCSGVYGACLVCHYFGIFQQNNIKGRRILRIRVVYMRIYIPTTFYTKA